MRFVIVLLSLLAQLGTIGYGETVTGTITDDDPVQRWTFTGSAGDVVSISMESSGDGLLDSLLQLLDAEDTLLAENDDASNITLDAAIVGFELPADGDYTIVATRFGMEAAGSTGDYTLTLTEGDMPSEEEDETATEEPDEPQPIADAQPLMVGSEVTGTLNDDNFEDLWTFAASAGDVVDIQMERTSGNLDTYLSIVAPNGDEIAVNNDGPEGIRSSEVLGLTLAEDGDYVVRATRHRFADGTSSGDYVLIVSAHTPVVAEEEAPEEPIAEEAPEEPVAEEEPEEPVAEEEDAAPVAQDGSVQYGQFVEGTFAPNAEDNRYRFAGSAGDVITISVKRDNSEFNPTVMLEDSSGEVLIFNSRFNGPDDARINEFALPSDGTYEIVVLADRRTSGDYILYLFAANATAADQPPVAEQEEPVTVEEEPDDVVVEEGTIEEPAIASTDAELVITLSWVGAADLDLYLVDPAGDSIDFTNPAVDSGGTFGGDANGGCVDTSTTPSEQTFWESDAPTGTYEIEVAYVFPCDVEGDVAYTVTITLDGEVVETFEDELSEGGAQTYEWSLE